MIAEIGGTVTGWLKPGEPLAAWWQRNYPNLREVSRDLAAMVLAARVPGTLEAGVTRPDPNAVPHIPVDTPGLRYFDYGLLGGAIDYRLRMEFTAQWGGDPNRSLFARAWAGRTGSLAHATAALLADCAPALAHAGPQARHLAESLPALAILLDECAADLDRLAPWDWAGPYAASGKEEPWLSDYCLVLASLDDFYRTFGSQFDFTPLLSTSGYRSVMYASGRPVRSPYWKPGEHPPSDADRPSVNRTEHRQAAAEQAVSELRGSWPLFNRLLCTPHPTLEELAVAASAGLRARKLGREEGSDTGRTRSSGGLGSPSRLGLLREDLEAQLALWSLNSARRAARPPRVIAANPTFSGSTRLPADGDLIVRSKDGTGYLMDFKSPKRIEPSGVLAMLRQILTYSLMDEGDQYEIRHVGFYFTRYGVWAHYGLQELLDRGMGGGRSKALGSHQEGLRRMLLNLTQPEVVATAIPGRRRSARPTGATDVEGR